MKEIKTPGGYIITKPIDIILTTCNRVEDSKETINQLYKRLKTPFRLIVIDDDSVDGTKEYLEKEVKAGRVHVLDTEGNMNISQAYNKGFLHVESDYFFCMQDDITVPFLGTCIMQQLIDLMEKYPDHGGIGCRIQRIPNINWKASENELVLARKALSAYFRIQKREDIALLGDNPFGNKIWDDVAFCSRVRKLLNKECSWAKDLWADHSRGYCHNRGYNVKDRKWGWGDNVGSHNRNQAIKEKPYPKIYKDTCQPLPGEKIYR